MRNDVNKKYTWEKGIVKCEDIFIVASMIFVVGVVCLNVVLRYALQMVPQGLDEMARFAMPIIVMIGSAIGIYRKNHITAGGIITFTSSTKLNKRAEIVIDILALSFCALFLFWSCKYFLSTFEFPSVSEDLGIPTYIIEGILPIGVGLWVLHYLLRIMRKIFYQNKK